MINRDDFEDAPSQAGPWERITAGVRNLWNAVNGLDARTTRQEKVTQDLSRQFAELQRELDGVKSELRGAKISKGKQKAKADRAMAAIHQAEQELEATRQKLNSLQ